MESNNSLAIPFAETKHEVPVNDPDLMFSWKTYKARQNFRLHLQQEALKRSLEQQMRDAKVLNMIELPPDNMDEEEIFNDRLEYREGELAGNYGSASKESIEAFYGESKPVFKFAQLPAAKNKGKMVEIPDLIYLSDKETIDRVTEDNVMSESMILKNLESSEDREKNENFFGLPDLLSLETEVQFSGMNLSDFTFVDL